MTNRPRLSKSALENMRKRTLKTVQQNRMAEHLKGEHPLALGRVLDCPMCFNRELMTEKP